MALSVSYNSVNYELQIVAGVLQIKTGAGSFIDSPISGITGARYGSPWIHAILDDGTARKMLVSDTSALFSSVDDAAILGEYNNAVTLNYDVIPAGSGSGSGGSGSGSGSTPEPKATFETPISMSGHKIVDGAAGTAPSDFVILSQLTALSQALTTVINAGDAAVQSEIDALEVVVANLPAGLTMAQVQAAIDASVAQAVLDEVIDDAQKQALVDAALAQLSTIDTAVIARVGATEALLASLEPRVAALETLTATHTTEIAAGVAKDASQDAAIAALDAGLANAVTVNNAQNVRLGNVEAAAALVNQAITPVEVQIANGAVASASGVALGDVSIDNSNTDHITVTINLGASNAGKRRVSSAYRVIAGKEEKFYAAEGRNGEAYTFTYLKSRGGSDTVNLVLN